VELARPDCGEGDQGQRQEVFEGRQVTLFNVAAASQSWATALGEDDPNKVLPVFLWGHVVADAGRLTTHAAPVLPSFGRVKLRNVPVSGKLLR
jgi:hypothetical protein